jgi:hypothetical protein
VKEADFLSWLGLTFVRKYCFPLCDWLLKNTVTFIALRNVNVLSQYRPDVFIALLRELYIFGSVQNINDCRIILDSVGHVMTTVRLAEELDYEFKQDSVVRMA